MHGVAGLGLLCWSSVGNVGKTKRKLPFRVSGVRSGVERGFGGHAWRIYVGIISRVV